jgi:hypothetical protein
VNPESVLQQECPLNVVCRLIYFVYLSPFGILVIMHFSTVVALFAAVAAASARLINVQVGLNGSLTYTPSSVVAAEGDIVAFTLYVDRCHSKLAVAHSRIIAWPRITYVLLVMYTLRSSSSLPFLLRHSRNRPFLHLAQTSPTP